MDHLLIQCSKTRMLCEFLFSPFGIASVITGSVKDILLSWNDPLIGKKRKKVWRANPLCLFWIVWKVRNGLAFRNEVLLIRNLKIRVLLCYVRSQNCLLGMGPLLWWLSLTG